MVNRLTVISIILFSAFAFSCSNVEGVNGLDGQDIPATVKRLNKDRNYDSLFMVTSQVFHDVVSDSVSKLYAGIYAANGYLLQEHLDSARYYIEGLFSDYRHHLDEHQNLLAMLYTLAGIYEMKTGWNFSKAFQYLQKSCDVFESIGDYRDMVPPLANIVQFFYIRSDYQGYEYAQKAYSIARREGSDPWVKCISAIAMAQMLSLSVPDAVDSPLPYIEEADSLATQNGFYNIYSLVELLYARYFFECGDKIRAEECFESALDWAGNVYCEPAVLQLVCLEYGRFCDEEGWPDRAVGIYRQGLEVSYRTGNIELRDKLLIAASDCAMGAGDNSASIMYYRQYLKLFDSLELSKLEKDFNNQVALYKRMEYEFAVKIRIILAVCALVILIVVILMLIIINLRQRKSYKVLFAQYHNSLSRLRAGKAEGGDRELWERLETAMETRKIFQRNNLSLESLAKEMGTNRTYLSNTINRFSGSNFNGYLDKYRIREAAMLIESSSADMTFKQIADAVGYNSLPVFYKAFSKETGLSPGKYREKVSFRKTEE